MDGTKKKTSRLPSLAIFKKRPPTAKPKPMDASYHTGTPVDDLDLSSVSSFLIYGVNSADIRAACGSPEMNSLDTVDDSQEAHFQSAEHLNEVNADERDYGSRGILDTERPVLRSNGYDDSTSTCDLCQRRPVGHTAAGERTVSSNYSLGPYVCDASVEQENARTLDDSPSEQPRRCRGVVGSGRKYDDLLCESETSDKLSSGQHHRSVDKRLGDGSGSETNRELENGFSNSATVRDNNVRCSYCTNQSSGGSRTRNDVCDYEKTGRPDKGSNAKPLTATTNTLCKHGKEFIAESVAGVTVDANHSRQGRGRFVCATNPLASGRFVTNTIRHVPGSETFLKNLGSGFRGSVAENSSSSRSNAAAHGQKGPALDQNSVERSDGSFGEWTTSVATSVMSRKSRSLCNVLDGELVERPGWLVAGVLDDEVLAEPKKKDKIGFWKEKIKEVKKFFSRRSSSGTSQPTIGNVSSVKARDELRFHLHGIGDGWKQRVGGSMAHLHASMDSGFDQRCGSTDHDLVSSASESKHDNTQCVISHRCDVGPNEVIYESIPSCGSQREVVSMENILDRCKSFESLSSDEGGRSDVRVPRRSDVRFISHHDLYSSRPYLRFRSRGRRSSCDDPQLLTPRSKSWHDISELPSFQSRADEMDSESQSGSSYYGVPLKRSGSSYSSRQGKAYRKYKNRYRRSGSFDLLAAGGAMRSSQRYMSSQNQLYVDTLLPEPINLSSAEHPGYVGRRRHKRVSMAASAAYIPGVSLSDKLRLAASKGQVEKVHELINAGATFEPDREGRTALHYAALNGQSEIVQILADEGADINTQDALGYTALHRAAAQGHLEVIKVLLVEGCIVDRQDEVHGNSPLHEAAWNGYSKTLELLIRHKANVHCINKAGFTALHLAAQNGHNQSARVLLYAGCNPDMKNNYGDTAIHTAARYGHAGVTRILISARCHISEQNKNGDTALHIAAALKRRKLTKLLVEAGIKTNIKNKQNETAVDVARRKEHPEIIAIITTQLKNAKKLKKNKDRDKDKNKKEKGSKLALNGEETTEKKGLFFKKKNKTKATDNTKQQKAVAAGVRVTDHPIKAPSEISSSEYNSQMAPEEILHGFREHQAAHHDRVYVNRGASTHGTTTKGSKAKVRGLLTEYVPKPGVQYYRDLAGNIRQGPVGYAPVCTCQPALKKLEKQMEVDRNNLYDHIDTSHKTLVERIETLDKRTSQQICSIDKMTKERLEAERRDREEYVHSCLRKDRLEMQENCEHKHTEMKHELKGYLDNRFTNFERYYGIVANKQDPCYWCYGNEHHNKPRYHDDDMLNQNNMVYDPTEPPMPGRLYKSKSDETLSVTSSHPSRRHWKLRTNGAEDVTDMKLAYMNNRMQRQERKMRSKSTGVSTRASSIEQLPRCRDGSLPAQRPLHIPEGDSGSNLHSEYKTYKDYIAKQHQWKAKRNPVGASLQEQFSQPEQHHPNKYNSLQRGTSQQVKVEVHQAERPRSASNSAAPSLSDRPNYISSNREISGNDMPRARSGSDYIRTRSSSASRAPDGSSYRQSVIQRQPPQQGMQPSQSAYSMTAGSQIKPGLPHSASYDNSSALHQRQQQQQHQHQRYAEHADSRVVNTQGHVVPDPPTRASSQHASQYGQPQQPLPQSLTTTPSSASLRWNPVHTSSPDTPLGMYSSPNNSDSLISSQKSSPLYPSPNCPKATRSESSSNPDSGYGSRLLGGRQISGPTLPGSTSSSFQSHEHNSSLSTNHSSLNEMSPLAAYDKEVARHQVANRDGQQCNGGRLAKMPTQYEQQQQQQFQNQQHQRYYQQHHQQYQQQQQQYQHQQPHSQLPLYQQYATHQQPKQYQQPQLRQSAQQQQQQLQQKCSSNEQKQQQQQQQQYPRIVSRWYEPKTSNPQQISNTNTRMWPPTHMSQTASGFAADNNKILAQSEHSNQPGIIGKATQV